MGKINSLFLRKSRGKLAGTTLYTTSGVTIQRELPGTIKNPRTKRQMTQRCKLTNLVNMYKAGKTFFVSAFENKKPLVSDYNMFVSKNLAANPVMLPKDYAAAGKFFAAPYQITEGSLGSVTDMYQGGGSVYSSLELGEFDSISDNTTIGALSTALLNNNNRLKVGDQLSVVVFVGCNNSTPSLNDRISFMKYELILNTMSTEKVRDFIPNLTVDDSRLMWDGSGETTGAAFVLSRTVSGKIYVSKEYLNGIDTQDVAFGTDTWMQAAIDSYGESKEVFLDSEEAHKA